MELVIEDYTKIIKQSKILDHISAKMVSGNIYGFQGVNGSGKTMLMRAIAGLILPTEGGVKVNGEKIGKDLSFPESMGILLENPAFLPGYTAFDNLKLLGAIRSHVTETQIKEALALVGLNPEDKRKYKKFSLGMKQRLGIAAAIFEDPELIILDEPFNALDEAGCNQITELLKNLKARGKLIILSCHNKEELEILSDKIFHIENGKLYEVESR